MKDRIFELCSYVAPSGGESELQAALLQQVRDVADEVLVDRMGNAIARKHGTGPHVMIAAHADEAGVMVNHIDDDGFLRLITIGDLDAKRLPGRHIRFTNGVLGVVGVEDKLAIQDITIDHVYVDIGATSAKQARTRVRIGLSGVVQEAVIELDEHRLAGRALDNRVGCAIAIEAFRTAAAQGKQVSLAFTAQQAVGSRGAQTAAFRLKPDIAFVIDAAPAGDMPDAPRMALRLGAGPALKILDRSVIAPVAVKELLMASAEAAGVAIQYEVWPLGLTDAGTIEATEAGIAIGGVSYPTRYVGGPTTVVDLRDAEAAVTWLVAAIEQTQSAGFAR